MHCWGERDLVQPSWRTAWRFPEGLKLDPATPLLDTQPKEMQSAYQGKAHAHLHRSSTQTAEYGASLSAHQEMHR